MSRRKKNKNRNLYMLLVSILILIVIALLLINRNSTSVINTYADLYKFNNNVYKDNKYEIGSKEYFLYKTNYLFYYLYSNTDINENKVYDTIDLDDNLISYITNIIYSTGKNICYSEEMFNSMSYYLVGRGIKIDYHSDYYSIKNNKICFNKFDNKYKNLIKDINIEDSNNGKIITFKVNSSKEQYSFIYKYDNNYNTYYLYKYKFEIKYDENNYVFDEDANEYIIMGQD